MPNPGLSIAPTSVHCTECRRECWGLSVCSKPYPFFLSCSGIYTFHLCTSTSAFVPHTALPTASSAACLSPSSWLQLLISQKQGLYSKAEPVLDLWPLCLLVLFPVPKCHTQSGGLCGVFHIDSLDPRSSFTYTESLAFLPDACRSEWLV